MAKNLFMLLAVLILAFASASLADWNTGDPAKWVQMPDLTELGIDVNATESYILADDFECTEPGNVLSVHIWASWLYDYPPYDDPNQVSFILSFHEDIPASQSSTGYSMPGDVIFHRRFEPGEFTSRIWNQGVTEGWMDPPEFYIWPADQIVWQYNFYLATGDFFQEGTVDSPIVYWLDVQAIPWDQEAFFGWKTSVSQWNDDAVWGDGIEPYFGPWFELRYPPGHEQYGQSLDLAFVVVGEEHEIDWGDAPQIPGGPGYPTTAANLGANHIIGGPWLGDAADMPDAEADGQPDPFAMGDDLNGADDENGVQIPVLYPGVPATISYEVNGADAFVSGWIDFNGDLIWQAAELVVSGVHTVGNHSVTITPPASSVIGQTFSRWRISTVGGLTPTGGWPDGEVEDHEVTIEESVSKWLQRPDLTPMGMDVHATEPIILADDFKCDQVGRITDITIWASWLNDYLPFGVDAGAVEFILSFHKDIPDSMSSTGYSMPGDPEWWMLFPAGSFSFGVWADSIEEGWFYPPDDSYLFPGDHVCWFYNFRINPEEAFRQWGTLDEPMVYWLDVQAAPLDPAAVFGWKTSVDHWNDDGVWGDGFEPYFGPWFELRYPPAHEYADSSIDLAFKLVTDPLSGAPTDREVPGALGLFQNVPNPFAGSTTIRYALPSEGRPKLEVFDVTGRLVAVLVDEPQSAGLKSVTWNGTDSRGRELPAGIYFYRLSTGSDARTMKMLLLK
jgi:hypothetical protein